MLAPTICERNYLTSTIRIRLIAHRSDSWNCIDAIRLTGQRTLKSGFISHPGGLVMYVPDPHFSGVDTFGYTATDCLSSERSNFGIPSSDEYASVALEVQNVNNRPMSPAGSGSGSGAGSSSSSSSSSGSASGSGSGSVSGAASLDTRGSPSIISIDYTGWEVVKPVLITIDAWDYDLPYGDVLSTTITAVDAGLTLYCFLPSAPSFDETWQRGQIIKPSPPSSAAAAVLETCSANTSGTSYAAECEALTGRVDVAGSFYVLPPCDSGLVSQTYDIYYTVSDTAGLEVLY